MRSVFLALIPAFVSPLAAASPGATDLDARPDGLHRQLQELNASWRTLEPDFAALPRGWDTSGEVGLIRTHLRLVIDRLERADVSGLDEGQKRHRRSHIAALGRYLQRGVFPANVYMPGRNPVFIDAAGTHCAVGQLMLESGHGDLAKRINGEHQLDYLADIATPGVADWQATSGLSFGELALIQPTYDFERKPSTPTPPSPQMPETRTISIPYREPGYANISDDLEVIRSQSALERFLKRQKKQPGWTEKGLAKFEGAFVKAKLDFDREAVVLIRHTSMADDTVHGKDEFTDSRGANHYCSAAAVKKGDLETFLKLFRGDSPGIIYGGG